MKKVKPSAAKPWWNFTGPSEQFEAIDPDQINRLYFPLCNEAGLLSAITPTLNGDIKSGQNQFLTLPVSEQDLHNTRSARQFWVYIEGRGAWSATASKSKESCRLEAGALWHRITRENRAWGVSATLTNFVPAGEDKVEIMRVDLTNIGRKPLAITPTAAIPLFGRSADNLRDHRHVTSLLHRIEQVAGGVLVTPTMSFDERGHHPNTSTYVVVGCEGDGQAPAGSFPTVMSFIGEGGHFEAPRAVLEDWDIPDLTDVELQGREAVGALRFKSRKLAPGKSATYIILMGIFEGPSPSPLPGERVQGEGKSAKAVASQWIRVYGSAEKVQEAFVHTREFWKERLDRLRIETHDPDYDRWVRWVTIQPMLRKVFGNSFLPDFDYGRGGRGWRDLWQDCLSLLLLEGVSDEASKQVGNAPYSPTPLLAYSQGVRALLLSNFAGVRRDGSNATIIGARPGEFVADRNNISRKWMDHGVWPWITVEFYLHQTGDFKFLLEEVPYFDDQGTDHGARSTVLEHILVQHLAAASRLGEHGSCRLEDGDWNDGLDMARDRGESVAFTAVYAGNLLRLADTLDVLHEKLGGKEDARIAELRQKGEALAKQVREREWIKNGAGHAWFNGYYDNAGVRVEGDTAKGVRMTLTGQVFPILSGVATHEQIVQAYAAVKRYLFDKKLGGFRLNTDFKEAQFQFGRAFSFAYGEKENGSFFSHMVVMLANALYRRGFVEEGYEVFSSLYKMAVNAEQAKIYPGIPEYFNGEGRGMYHYLTGSASWYLLTLVTQVLGIRGQWGDLLLAPKLMPEQFGKSGQIQAEVPFAGKRLHVTYLNRSRKPYGQYRPESILLQGKTLAVPATPMAEILIPRARIQEQAGFSVDITVALA